MMKNKYEEQLTRLNRTQSEVFLVFILCTDDVAKCFEENVRIYVNFNFKFKLYKEKKCRRGQVFFSFFYGVCLKKKYIPA